MEVDTECRNYRLRLGLPELSQPFFGSWLSPDPPSTPHSFFFDSYPPSPPSTPSPSPSPSPSTPPPTQPLLLPLPSHSTSKESLASFGTDSVPLRIKEKTSVAIRDDFRSDDGVREAQEIECRSGVELSSLWLEAGRYSGCKPSKQDWEVTHEREELLGAKISAAISGKFDHGNTTRDLVPKYPNATKEESRVDNFIFDSIQELDLVRAALRALQGVPTAVSWLEQLAADFSSTAADRSSEKFTTLWTRSSSSRSLGKVLKEFAKAGRVACQLDHFTSFFCNLQNDSHVAGTNGAQNASSRDSGRKKRKRQSFMNEGNNQSQLDTTSEIWEDLGGSNMSPHCHTNQAFAVAVKVFMQGNLASLDKIKSSVSHRRQIASGQRSVHSSEGVHGEAGLVFGFGCGDVTLLELLLHSHRQREQLQALAAVCRITEGDSLGGNNPVDGSLPEDVNINSSPLEMETDLFSASRNAFKEFPRGADLLSYLFDQLSVADTLHQELIRFLFERTCQPYMVFIRSWLYLATVQDPFGEFFVKALPLTDLKKRPGKSREQDALLTYQIPDGVNVPSFLEEVRTPLLRAGQQLQVLSKLLDTPSAIKIIESFQDSLPDSFMGKSSLDGQILHTSRKNILGDEQQLKRSSQMFKVFQDASLSGLTTSPPVQRMGRTRSWLSGVEDKSEKKTWTIEEIREANAKSYRETTARAALLRAEGEDDTSIASPTGRESPESLVQSPTLLEDKSRELHAAQRLKSRLLNHVHSLNPESETSFISDFQRGTSWPVLGLPKNPFRSFRDEGDDSSNYTCTVFPENNGCWDVNIHWKDPTRNQSLDEWPTSEPRHGADDQKVDGDHPLWIKNLEEYLGKQLTSGLDEQISEAHNGSFSYQDDDCRSASSLGFQPWDCNVRVERFSALQRNSGRRLQIHSHWEFEEEFSDSYGKQDLDSNLIHRKKEDDVKSTSDADVKHEYRFKADSLEDEDEKSPTPRSVDIRDSGSKLPILNEMNRPTQKSSSERGEIITGGWYVGSGSTWESYLHSEYCQIADTDSLQPAPLSIEDEDEDEEIPLSVAVKLWIDEEIMYQYKRTSMLTIRLLQESLHLQDHFAALRRYYFMERGDWAEYFLSALCKYEWNCLGGEPQLLEVQSMLNIALQNSSCEGDEFADRLYVVQSGHDSVQNPFLAFSNHKHSLGTSVDCNKIEAFDFIKLGYKVEWPLCLIITPSAISRYSSIFTFLLRLKLTICALADVWRSLQAMGYSLNKGRRSPNYQEQNRKFRTLQHFRQQIGHTVTTLHRYTESQILHAVWSKFLYSVENEVNDIQDLEKVHSIYLDDAYHHCFLSSEMEDAKTCIDVIMQCTLDFRNTLLAANLERSRDLVPLDEEVFQKVMEVKSVFEVHLQEMYSFHQRPDPQYSVILSDLWMCLNYNGCLKPFQK